MMFYSRFKIRVNGKLRRAFLKPLLKINSVKCLATGFRDGVVVLRTWNRNKWKDAAVDHLRIYLWLLENKVEILEEALLEEK